MWNTRISSRRASPVDLRGGLSGFAVDKFSGTLCVRGRGEYCSVVSSQHFQPGCDIGCVIFARFQSKLQVSGFALTLTVIQSNI